MREAGRNDIKVVGGRYGLGSKEFNPTMVKAVYDNLDGELKNHFTVGIMDDVTGTSLPVGEQFDAAPEGTIALHVLRPGLRRYRRRQQELHQDHRRPHRHVRSGATSAYDSKKSGGLTVSHLRFGKTPIQSPYLIDCGGLCGLPQPRLCDQVRHGVRAQGRRRVPAQLPLDRRARWTQSCPLP